MKPVFLFLAIFLGCSLGNAQLVPINTLFSAESSSSPFVGPPTAGGDSFGGGDNVDIRKHTAWFYGTDPISTCFHVTSDFGLDSSQIRSQLNEVVGNWQDYFRLKKINLKRDKKINTQFLIKDECEGGESLVLYLGTGPIFSSHLDLRARQNLTRPVAYVNKTHVSTDYTWSKGYIRFVGPEVYSLGNGIHFPIWTQHYSFTNLLKHEIGHILGFTHVPNTIMDKGISSQQFVVDDVTKEKLDIDGLEELVPCSDCDIHYSLQDSEKSKWQKVVLKSNDEIVFQGQDMSLVANVQSIVYHQDYEAHLLSMFSNNKVENPRPHVVFLRLNGEPLSLEFDKSELILRAQGENMTRYIREAHQ